MDEKAELMENKKSIAMYPKPPFLLLYSSPFARAAIAREKSFRPELSKPVTSLFYTMILMHVVSHVMHLTLHIQYIHLELLFCIVTCD
jgi:hypothetical protein